VEHQVDLLKQAKELGALVNSGSVCLPADTLTAFLNIAAKEGRKIRYIECLYFHEPDGAAPQGTEPSLELSRDMLPGQSVEDFIAQVEKLARLAVERAAHREIRPYFQVGLDPELDPEGSDIPVRPIDR
jgi:hypothetical protein